MDYKIKRTEIANIIIDFLNNDKTIKELQDYSWRMIDEFSAENEIDEQEDINKNIFWFAVWQMQHLASAEHLKDGTLERDLRNTLKYLLGQIPMPPGSHGLPPL